MDRRDRRDRLPGRRSGGSSGRQEVTVAAGSVVVLVGLFSAKVKDYRAQMDEAGQVVVGLGGRVVEAFVQRRGVSDGGVAAMSRPFSSRTLVTSGKVRQIAEARARWQADAVIFVNPLTPLQIRVLSSALDCPVASLSEIDRGGRP